MNLLFEHIGKTFLVKACATVGFVAVFTVVQSVRAQSDINIATTPLETSGGPKPKVLILADDSRSMDWEVVVLGEENSRPTVGARRSNGTNAGVPRYHHHFTYSHLFSYERIPSTAASPQMGTGGNRTLEMARHATGGNYHSINDGDGKVVPLCDSDSNTSLLAGTAVHTARLNELCWKMRSPLYNTLYYDDNVNYESWGPEYGGYEDDFYTRAPLWPALTTDNTVQRYNLIAVQGYSVSLPEPNSAPLPHEGSTVYTYATAQNLAFYYEEVDGQPVKRFVAPERRNNFARWFTFYRKRLLTTQSGMARALDQANNADIGFTTLEGTQKATLDTANSPTVLKNLIFKMRPYAGTPLRRKLYEAGRYFQCENGLIPDDNIMGLSQDNARRSCLVDPASELAQCQQYSTILTTDGYWADTGVGVGSEQAILAADQDTGGDFGGGPFADAQNGTLADVAMYFYKTDLDGNASNNHVPPAPTDLTRIANPNGHWGDPDATNYPVNSMHQHMKTHTILFGIDIDANSMRFPEYVGGEWQASPWPRRAVGEFENTDKITDLIHAAFNSRGIFENANNAAGMKDAIEAAVNASTARGASVGLSFSSPDIAASGTYVYRAGYNTSDNSGDVQAQAVTRDLAVTDVWSTSAQLEAQLSAVRQCNPAAGSNDGRTIFTYDPAGGNGVPFTAANLGSALTAAQVDWLRGHRYPETSCVNGSLRSRENSALLGDIIHSKPLFVTTPARADRDSAPYPTNADDSYRTFVNKFAGATPVIDRDNLVLVGANDGFFHAFNADDGTELFAYAPRMLIDGDNQNNKLADLTSPYYVHNYFVDLTPAVNDAFIDDEWRSVVIGGLGAGGRGYFALDITATSGFNTQTAAANKVLWEFSDETIVHDPSPESNPNGYGGLGYTFSPPVIVMSNVHVGDTSTPKKWYAIFGNGYNSATGTADLIILDIEKGMDGSWESGDFFVLRNADAVASVQDGVAVKNGLSTPRVVDIDENGTADFVYAGDLRGNMYRYDLTASSEAGFTATTIFTATAPEDNNPDAERPGESQAITTQPIAVRHPDYPQSVVVIAATGSWMLTTDLEDKQIHSIYGVWDRPGLSSVLSRDDLTSRVLVNEFDGANVVRNFDQNSNVGVAWYSETTPGDTSTGSGAYGWYIDFDMPAAVAPGDTPDTTPQYRGEKAVRRMVIRNNVVTVTTLISGDADECSANVFGSVLSFNAVSGNSAHSSGEGADPAASDGALIENGTPSDPIISGDSVIIEISTNDGSVLYDGPLPAIGAAAGRLSWRQLK